MIDLRHAEPGDVAAITGLLEELDRFYGSVDFPPIPHREQQIATLLFGPLHAGRVLLAYDERDAVGLAAYSYLWPAAGVTQSLYLKELYVRHTYRRQGVGTRLMARICAIATETGCSRVEWTTDRDNNAAQAFYEQLGAPTTTKVMYRLQDDHLPRIARQSHPPALT